jgi:hypothetical protein
MTLVPYVNLPKNGAVMPDVIRHPEIHWIPAFAGMTMPGQLGDF